MMASSTAGTTVTQAGSCSGSDALLGICIQLGPAVVTLGVLGSSQLVGASVGVAGVAGTSLAVGSLAPMSTTTVPLIASSIAGTTVTQTGSCSGADALLGICVQLGPAVVTLGVAGSSQIVGASVGLGGTGTAIGVGSTASLPTSSIHTSIAITAPAVTSVALTSVIPFAGTLVCSSLAPSSSAGDLISSIINPFGIFGSPQTTQKPSVGCTSYLPAGQTAYTTTLTAGATDSIIVGKTITYVTVFGQGSVGATQTIQPSGTLPGTVSIIEPTPATTCGNTGVQYAIYTNIPFYNNDVVYSSFQPAYFKNVKPYYNGTTAQIGVNSPETETEISVYGSPKFSSDYFALDHRAYLYAPQTGSYTFTSTKPDDIVYIWLGSAVSYTLPSTSPSVSRTKTLI